MNNTPLDVASTLKGSRQISTDKISLQDFPLRILYRYRRAGHFNAF